MNFSLTKENIIEQGKRILKVFEFGAKTAKVASSFGDDSAPLKDMIAIYANTSESGDAVIIGYLNKNQISQPGEKRIFSLKSDGSLSFAVHLKNDGTCEIGGALDNAVRYAALNNGLVQQNLKLQIELNKIAIAINAIVPGSYTPGNTDFDISASKINEIKTP